MLKSIRFMILATLLLLPPTTGSAQQAVTPGEAAPEREIVISRSDQSGIRFTYTPGAIETAQGETPAGGFDILKLEGGYSLNRPGYPSLPVKNFYIAIPPGMKPEVRVSGRPGGRRFGSLKPFIRREEGRIKTDEVEPIDALVKQVVGRIRDLDVLLLTVSAVRYDPVTGTAVSYDRIDIDVGFNPGFKIRHRRVPEDRFARKILSRLLLNYDRSRNWHYRLPGTSSMVPGSPFDSSSTWYKITTGEEGLYRIDYTTLFTGGIIPEQVDPRTIRIFGSPGDELPIDNDEPYPMLREMSVYVSGGSDGEFNNNDYILFYGPAINRFANDTLLDIVTYHSNSYTRDNVFFLTFGAGTWQQPPRRWDDIDIDISNPSLPKVIDYDEYLHFEENKVLRTDSGGEIIDYFRWYLGRIEGFSPDLFLQDVVSGDTGIIYSLAHSRMAMVTVNGVEAVNSFSNNVTTSKTLSFQDGWNQLEFSYPSEVTFDYYEIEYKREIKVNDKKLRFRAPETGGNYIFRVQNADGQNLLLDITDPLAPKKLSGGSSSGGNWEFQYASGGKGTEFFYCEPDTFLAIKSMDNYIPAGLRDVTNSADAVILTYDGFEEQARRLAAHRASHSNITVYVANISDVYNEFGWGRPDPLAIRYFLKYAFENWSDPKPASTTLIGDGHYDYLNHLSMGITSYMPPYENLPAGEYRSWASDDNYVFFGADGYYDSDSSDFPDMVIARLPVKSSSQLEDVVDKIIYYDADLELGSWQNTITIVADDEYGEKITEPSEWFHTDQAEELSILHVPNRFKKSKIYGIAYPMQEGRSKPQVREQILRSFNDGTLVIDYIGHGSKNVWMHEHTFRRAEDIPKLTNRKKPALVIAASCSVGRYDDPDQEGMSEELVRWPNGGAIAAIAATRSVIAGPNSDLNIEVFDLMLYSDSLSMADALFLAKLNRQTAPIENDRHFEIFADAEQKLAMPSLNVDITSVSTVAAPDTIADTLHALGLIRVEGRVEDTNGSLKSDFNGTVNLNVYDALKGFAYPGNWANTYYLPGNIVFRGSAEVSGGEFTSFFLMPRDINYGGNTAKIIAYVMDEDQIMSGSGYYGNCADGRGPDTLYLQRAIGTVSDSAGPEITLFIDNSELTSSYTSVSEDFALRAVITDSSGINMTGQAGHFISLRIDGGETLDENITDHFNYDLGDYRTGQVSYDVTDLDEGEHRIEFKAWDNLNNSTLREFIVNVGSQEETRLQEVMNYPNPFENRTVFQYRLNRDDVNNVDIKIFTLSGLLIKTITSCPADNSYNYVEWNGRDDDGDEIGNGVYIYKVTATGPGGKSESFQKALKLK